MINLLKYLASGNGRTARFIGGSVISAAGLFVSPALIAIGLLPLFTSIFDVCVLAPFLKLPFEGEKLREALSK